MGKPTLVDEYLAARTEREAAEERFREIEGRMLKEMETDKRKTYRWTEDGLYYSLTYVASDTTVIDEKGLRKALKAKVFDKYTVRKLDRRAMERAMDTGEVDKTVVARFVSLVPRKPYLNYRVRPIPEEKN